MPTGTPKAGFRRSKSYWSKVVDTQSAQDIELNLQKDAPRYIEELTKLTKPIVCPECGNEIKVIDKDVLMYLVDHAIGKSKQRQEVDITSHVQLNADQIDSVMRNHLRQVVEMYLPEILEILSQRKLLTEGKEI